MFKKAIDILTSHRLLLVIYVLAAVWGVLMQYFASPLDTGHNNYDIYTGVARHFFDMQPLYGPSPGEYNDMNHYGPVFAFLIYPFSLLPHLAGVMIWVVASAIIFCLAVRQLPISIRSQALILLLCISEFYNAAVYQQFNTLTVAMIILSYTFIAHKREGLSALMIVIGTMVKLYGIVGLAFFFFIKPERRVRFVVYLLLWTVALLGLQVLCTSWDYVIGQYGAWMTDIGSKNATNLFSPFQNRGLLGVIRKVSGEGSYSDIWIIGSGLLLYLSSYLRRSRWADRDFHLLLLSSTLLFVVLFSTGTETCSYITAMAGVGIWWFTKSGRGTVQDPSRVLHWSLLVFVIIGSLANAFFPPSIYHSVIFPYALKAVPFTLVWLCVSIELLLPRSVRQDPPRQSSTTDISREIDIVLPIYNPGQGWVERIIHSVGELQRAMPDYTFSVILSDDGSTHGIDESDLSRLQRAIPRFDFVHSFVNQGKGATVRAGVSRSTAPTVIYTDYDFPYSIQSILQTVRPIVEQRADIAMAVRNESYYRQLSVVRRWLSHASKHLNSRILGLAHPDAQGGLKAFNVGGRDILLSTRINRFLFDTEFIRNASRREDLRIEPVECTLRPDVHLPSMGLNVIRRELVNFLGLLFSQCPKGHF